MQGLKWSYKVVRSILLTALIAAGALVLAVYLLLSIPPVQHLIKSRAETELSNLLEGHSVNIGDLSISPFNELFLKNVTIKDDSGIDCVEISILGAGLNFWNLIIRQKIEITYIELLNFNISVSKSYPDSPYNIDFIINAFKPKGNNKPSPEFDLKIRNIVLRGGTVSFDKLWKAENPNPEKIDFNHLKFTEICADLAFPVLRNSDIQLDLRRLAFNEKSGLEIKEIGFFALITPENLEIKNLIIRLPQTEIKTNELSFDIPKSGADQSFTNQYFDLQIKQAIITPSDLSCFWIPLRDFNEPLSLNSQIEGTLNDLTIRRFELGYPGNVTMLDFNGSVSDILDKQSIVFNINKLNFDIKKTILTLFQKYNHNYKDNFFFDITDINGSLSGEYNAKQQKAAIEGQINSNLADAEIKADVSGSKKGLDIRSKLLFKDVDITNIFPASGIGKVSELSLEANGILNTENIQSSSGVVNLGISELYFKNNKLDFIEARLVKESNLINLSTSLSGNDLNVHLDSEIILNGTETEGELSADVSEFNPYNFHITSLSEYNEITGKLNLNFIGNDIQNAVGNLSLKDFFIRKNNGDIFTMKNLNLSVDNTSGDIRQIIIESDIVDAKIEENLQINQIVPFCRELSHLIIPSLFQRVPDRHTYEGRGDFIINVKNASPLADFFNLSIKPLSSFNIEGYLDANNETMHVETYIPYIQQGAKTLIRDSYLNFTAEGNSAEARVFAGTVYPTKKGDLKMDMSMLGKDEKFRIYLDFNEGLSTKFDGRVSLQVNLFANPFSRLPDFDVDFLASTLTLNSKRWNISDARINYLPSGIKVDGFKLWSGKEFLTIQSIDDSIHPDKLEIKLENINLDYIFETLNIDHVEFGGEATGLIQAYDLLTPNPHVQTEYLDVRDLSYGKALLGQGKIESGLSLPERKVTIKALVTNEGKKTATVDGGVWFGPDSLSFAFDADKVNVEFIQPFMKAFSSRVGGKATGQALLYGTFKDVNMTGEIFTDNFQLLVDYTNVTYTGAGCVYMTPGIISLKDIKLTDSFGHQAKVNGVLTHDYFHDPAFKFEVTDMDNVLCYNTTSRMNPRWYGKLFASGTAKIEGEPGIVGISADAVTTQGSEFTFVLSDAQEAIESSFLTFSDSSKKKDEILQELVIEMPEYLKYFKNETIETKEEPDIFTLDIRAEITPDLQMNLIMDPVAGDKINGVGSGAMNLQYSSSNDELEIFGKYTLDKGIYKFSLQDIILKDFIIKPGSSVTFTGDPFDGILDISGAYRVNANLAELDKSFSNDRELNRTNVPVEALLKVTGHLISPDISFDIDLPTVTEETNRKVKSIISTDDMMNRQVLYLVALNKFYAPEYMAPTGTGAEWASVASSTVSSQLQNMIGQLTDKFTISPNLRSEKGDFSDLEVDVMLSSSLFNNRLLINGNLGYRDKNTSNTTFVGDFDVEYLLNRSGKFRLKAYNHFNDRNYYLKSALTTQGLGIIWRQEFDNLFRRKKKEKIEDIKETGATSEEATPE